jgi:serine protease Do
VLLRSLFIASWNNSHGLTTVEIVAKVKPAVVLIGPFDSNEQPLGFGTGFFIAPNQVVTNSYVIRNARYLEIEDLSGTYYHFNRVLDDNSTFDLAILETKETSNAFLNFGNSQNLLAGQSILIIGNLKGLVGTVSVGIVSAIRDNGRFQFTAPISPGSSWSLL